MSSNDSFSKLASELWADEDLVFDAKAQDLAIRLAYEVGRTGLNQAQLAEKLDWKPSRVSRVLTGSTNLTMKTIFQICRAIDLDFDVVLRRPEEKTLVVDKDYHHAYLREAKSTLDRSQILLETVTELNRRVWRQARDIQRFRHPEPIQQGAQVPAV